MLARTVTKTVTAAVFLAAGLTYAYFNTDEAPLLPLICWPLMYGAVGYWIGLESVSTQEPALRHKAGLKHILHGAIVGLIVSIAAVAIRFIGIQPYVHRFTSLAVAGVGGTLIYLYMKLVYRRPGGATVCALLFGGMPIWTMFAPPLDG